ncbi:putative secreted protein (Por secretion system target) [Ulvibacter sp. MAR_2010_11]|uniref:T9SS type A sorting domain-containing protein n=1 Tax=Ulvibacter sp. MAR_2010_11 TaxID=1250229 RepID=UPI000C2BBC3E|nr:T9SS type A sorting domain-containing protein [Ulvibacter sp. MAR_2010_11]PKA83447.1 putative secreted protein (Por secretion system target) [Ulvibacter sp. MAR_2010_11]
MKKLLLLSTLFVCVQISFGQCPSADIVLTSQADIDNFATTYPNCTVLTHDLRVDGVNSDIINLNGLAPITDAVDIIILTTQITNLIGLDNLESVTHLALWGNPGLQNMSGLDALQSVGQLEIWVNSGLLSMDGMDNLQAIEQLNLFGNSNLSDISQFSFVQNLRSLTLGGNSLSSLAGLENLQTVLEDVAISDESVINFNELSNLQSIGGSLLLSNSSVEDVSAFSNITSLIDLYVVECPNLTNLAGLQNVDNISGRLRIGFNPGLTNLSAFNTITNVTNLDIYENENLESLQGLENLNQVTERMLIMDNPFLTSIEAINGVSPVSINELVILNNTSLSVCNNNFVCAVINEPSVNKSINNNASGCNSVAEVIESCILGISEAELALAIGVYPNPVSDKLTISVSDAITFEKAVIYSVLGQQIVNSSEKVTDVSFLSQGIYFVNITTNKGEMVYKIVKE